MGTDERESLAKRFSIRDHRRNQHWEGTLNTAGQRLHPGHGLSLWQHIVLIANDSIIHSCTKTSRLLAPYSSIKATCTASLESQEFLSSLWACYFLLIVLNLWCLDQSLWHCLWFVRNVNSQTSHWTYWIKDSSCYKQFEYNNPSIVMLRLARLWKLLNESHMKKLGLRLRGRWKFNYVFIGKKFTPRENTLYPTDIHVIWTHWKLWWWETKT